MTTYQIRMLLRQASAFTPHEPGALELAESYIPYMKPAELLHAARCYAAIVGERTLPKNWKKT